MVCVFKHLYCSAQLSMSNMEKRYRNEIIIIIIIITIVMPFHNLSVSAICLPFHLPVCSSETLLKSLR